MEKTNYKLVLSCPSGLSPSQVSVVFDPSYDRIAHPDIELENSISEIWDQRVQKNASLYNGKKFRYGGYTLCNRGGSQQDFHVCLHLGLTDYRTFVGTNLNPLWEKFLVPSEDDLMQCQHTSSPLGNGAILETSDKKIVVLQRSYNVGEFPGHVVFPGGHPEPEEVGAASHQMGERLTNSEHNNTKVLFHHCCQGVIALCFLFPILVLSCCKWTECNPLFIGISRRVLNVRPAAFFFIKCNIESKEIQRLYAGAQDGYESTQLYTVSLIELENMASKMPGCHQGGLALYKLMLEAMKNI
ncbi:nudix hydrolase 9 isoform X1 [Populus alba]|uniref:Nudix hydrolase 9 isoform X1 n=1 Tax=Populus alba x Populus x berolinensis TaxID=444605 RepID=A0AAD6MHF6_9ROSI|nr:nudix hydrolase 9 isoform X1 [Populus alba]KAJ6984347.1 nudix hydrolase 9 isoform X1 [Populus alba x Populus x berolinensis]